MPPKRKKLKTTSEENNRSSQEHETRTQDNEATNAHISVGSNAIHSTSTPQRSSWYSYNSWRTKGSPIAAEIAPESISVARGASNDPTPTRSARPSNSVSKSIRGSRKSVPLAAEATRVHATSDASTQSRPLLGPEAKLKGIPKESALREDKETTQRTVEVASASQGYAAVAETATANDEEVRAQSNEGVRPKSWLGWWGRPDGYGGQGETAQQIDELSAGREERSAVPVSATREEIAGEGQKNAQPSGAVEAAQLQQGDDTIPYTKSRSWFGFWSNAQNEKGATSLDKTAEEAASISPESINTQGSQIALSTNKTKATSIKDARSSQGVGGQKSSAWAFWSSNRPKDSNATPSTVQKEVGELAVADTPSQSKPEVAYFNDTKQSMKMEAGTGNESSNSLPSVRSGHAGRQSKAPPSIAKDVSPVSGSAACKAPTPSATSSRESSQPPKRRRAHSRANSVSPSLQDTYPDAMATGYLDRLTSYFASSLHIPGSAPAGEPKHVSLSASPPKIRRAVVLGVHGYFPAALLQKFLGPPTGTSIRFANHAATALQKWCQEHQPEIKDLEIEKVALEGEGYIADRIKTLWELLLNWLSHLRKADFILVSCHSQGVPVAIALLAKLIQLECLRPEVRMGVCAMAGVNSGPFLEYRSRFFSGAALELFDFADPCSEVSRSYQASLEICLRNNVRMTFVASLDDQLVSLDSALFSRLRHPYVARTIFIDGRLETNFLTHLLTLALKLRNLGCDDHGLVNELSGPLAGSLVGGDGHSRIYDDEQVYLFAIGFAMESTDVRSEPDGRLPLSPSPATAVSNPFTLPWAVRGMLEEDMVKKIPALSQEVKTLVKEFESWRPTTKMLKDVKWRLEGVERME